MKWTYNAVLDACVVEHFHKSLVSPVGMLMVDVVLLVSMLIGLLRHVQRSSTGIWHFLYQQVVPCPLSLHRMLTSTECIVWIVLASIAEVPLVVGLFRSLMTPYSCQSFPGLCSSRFQRFVSESMAARITLMILP
jgi:hypothetical protein